MKIAAIFGEKSFKDEQLALVSDTFNSSYDFRNQIFQKKTNSFELTCECKRESERQSKVDIVIATPGRLVDHLNGTLGFTLQHLRYLVFHRH
jgi:ATP-dependent RNA helicase DDX51/DBP6